MKTIVVLAESFRRPPWEAWMEDLPQRVAALPPSQLIRNGRNRVYWIEHEGQKFVVKHFLNNGAWKKLAYRIATGKARRSFDHSIALIRAGVKSPQPIGWREDWEGPFLKESFYVSAHVEVAQTARAIRHDKTTDWRPHVTKIARSIARMHDARILHRDLTAGNILFVTDSAEQWPVYIIDNNRMSFGDINLRKGIKSLLQAKIEGEYQAAYVTAYAQARGFDSDFCLRLYEDLMGGYKMKWRIKDITRPWRRKIGL